MSPNPLRRDMLRLLLAAGLPLTASARNTANTPNTPNTPKSQPLGPKKAPLQHYVFFHNRGDDGAELRNEAALRDPRFSGAQVTYTWRSLEATEGVYDFSAILADLDYMQSLSKKLWIQLQEKSFTARVNVPDYLRQDPRYGGGVLRQSMDSAPERDKSIPLADDEYGWVANLWLPPSNERFQALLRELGRALDGRIAGINLSETAIDIGQELPNGHTRFPKGFSPAQYVRALQANMVVLAGAFRQSVPMVYLNYLPDEWLPWQDHGYMRSLFATAEKLGMGVGGPDLVPYKKGPMLQSYPFFHAYPQRLFKGMAVQSGNLRQRNPHTGVAYTVADLLDFANDYLGLDVVFWGIEDPSFQTTVLEKLPA
jgi:hypothetical protein